MDEGRPNNAVAMLIAAFTSIVQEFIRLGKDPESEDVGKIMATVLGNKKIELESAIKKLESVRATVAKFSKRFESKSGESLFEPVIQSQLADIDNEWRIVEARLADTKDALAILDAYTYKHTPKRGAATTATATNVMFKVMTY